jgi:hypothetical protein
VIVYAGARDGNEDWDDEQGRRYRGKQ